nr:alpha/beta hydrolase [Microbacterium paraoxydans]
MSLRRDAPSSCTVWDRPARSCGGSATPSQRPAGTRRRWTCAATETPRARSTTPSQRTPRTSPPRAPPGAGAWDAVVGHSLGGAAGTVAAADDADWTRRLVLIDPAIHVVQQDAADVRRSQERAFADNRLDAVRQEHPHWHPQDQELKVDAVRRASAWAVEQTSAQNQPWDVRAHAARLTVPTHVIGADPAVSSIFTGALADEVLASNPRISLSVVAGAGHSVHRDRPEESIRQLLEALA